MTTAQYYTYLNTTYPNDAATRGELAGAAYRFQQYMDEGFGATVARNQGKMNPKRAALLTAKGEDTNYGGLT
jgi:hypothetical protein